MLQVLAQAHNPTRLIAPVPKAEALFAAISGEMLLPIVTVQSSG